jgi:hypothetical protein
MLKLRWLKSVFVGYSSHASSIIRRMALVRKLRNYFRKVGVSKNAISDEE